MDRRGHRGRRAVGAGVMEKLDEDKGASVAPTAGAAQVASLDGAVQAGAGTVAGAVKPPSVDEAQTVDEADARTTGAAGTAGNIEAAGAEEAAGAALHTGLMTEPVTEETEFEPAPTGETLPSEELVRLSWEASSRRDLERLDELVNQCVAAYGAQAKEEQAGLAGFPERGREAEYRALNDVGTCLFIKAEAVMNSGRTKEAIKQFKEIIAEYPCAQAWDPRGWFWSVTEKSQASIDVLTGKAEEEFLQTTEPVALILPPIDQPGTAKIVDYTKYGEFENVGTEKYFYRMRDPDGLAQAAGEGIYPNIGAVYDNPRYKIVKEEGRLDGSHWDFVRTPDLEAAYFKW